MGFKLTLNGEPLKEFDGMHETVQSVALRSSQGEEGIFNVPNHIDTVDIVVNMRDLLESNYLDLDGIVAAQERRERVEEGSKDKAEEGRKLMRERDEPELTPTGTMTPEMVRGEKEPEEPEGEGTTTSMAQPSDAEDVEEAQGITSDTTASGSATDTEQTVEEVEETEPTPPTSSRISVAKKTP